MLRFAACFTTALFSFAWRSLGTKAAADISQQSNNEHDRSTFQPA